jgi:hypothetical protein
METQEYHVEGPVMIFLTTTAIDIDEELLNRCLLLSVDESQGQTERIHTLQREARTLEGLQRKKRREKVLTLLRNAQRLLEPVDVVNPYAAQLTFSAKHTRTRRDHEKYLTLIDTIALLHQHQRPRRSLEGEEVRGKRSEGRPESGGAKGEDNPQPETRNQEPETAAGAGAYIEVTLADIALANQLAPELLGRSLDELPPQTRRVLDEIKGLVKARCEAEDLEPRTAFFSRRELRERLGWSVTQIRAHLERLRDLEYLAARYGRPGSSYQYELLVDPRAEADTNLAGLLDPEKLRLRSEPVGENGNLSGGCRPPPRQVETQQTPAYTHNLSACSDRTSGTATRRAS